MIDGRVIDVQFRNVAANNVTERKNNNCHKHKLAPSSLKNFCKNYAKSNNKESPRMQKYFVTLLHLLI